MTSLILKRIASNDGGTFGVLVSDGTPFALTLEDPWRDNQKNASCIPDNIYACRRTVSPKFGETFEVTGVPDRSHILLHTGNTEEDTHGCILVGESFGRLNGRPAVLSSKDGFRELMEVLRGVDGFELKIEWAI